MRTEIDDDENDSSHGVMRLIRNETNRVCLMAYETEGWPYNANVTVKPDTVALASLSFYGALWHMRLGHFRDQVLSRLVKYGHGLENTDFRRRENCQPCKMSKKLESHENYNT